MLESLQSLFQAPVATSEAAIEQQLHLAAAALLIEMSQADRKVDAREQRELETLLPATLGISPQAVQRLLQLAGQAADRATSLYEFTRLINDHYQRAQKLRLIHALWRVAYADGDLDKYEEHLIRQVADLIHVPHRDYIRLKLSVTGG